MTPHYDPLLVVMSVVIAVLGMGPSISRSIIENHGGQLWAVANDGPGTTFQFTV